MMNESQNVEWKQQWQDEYLKWICDFTNAQGGASSGFKRFVHQRCVEEAASCYS